jgi:hypothetical protein
MNDEQKDKLDGCSPKARMSKFRGFLRRGVVVSVTLLTAVSGFALELASDPAGPAHADEALAKADSAAGENKDANRYIKPGFWQPELRNSLQGKGLQQPLRRMAPNLVSLPKTERRAEIGVFVRPGDLEVALARLKMAQKRGSYYDRPTDANARDEIGCLALNVYFEARSEPIKGQHAVAHVVLNRVADPRFPESACEVVRQGGQKKKAGCQFSWFCDGLSDDPVNGRLWRQSYDVALAVYWGKSEDPTEGALWYHADYVSPAWRHDFDEGPTIGRHIFYHPRYTSPGFPKLPGNMVMRRVSN